MFNGLTLHSDQSLNTTKKRKKRSQSRNTLSENNSYFRAFWYQNSGTWILLPYAFFFSFFLHLSKLLFSGHPVYRTGVSTASDNQRWLSIFALKIKGAPHADGPPLGKGHAGVLCVTRAVNQNHGNLHCWKACFSFIFN